MRRRRAVRAVAVLALLLLPAATVGSPASAQSAPSPSAGASPQAGPSPSAGPVPSARGAAPEPEAPVTVDVTTLAPRAPRPGGRLQVAGTLRNTGSSPVSGLRVALRVGDRLSTRSQLALADAEGVVTDRVRSSVVSDPRPLPPGATRRFDLRVDVSALPLRRDGAYPLEVEVRGRVGGGGRAEPVGLAGTYLPWFASPPSGTTRIAWVWPLVAEPAQAPRRTDRGPVLLDEDLAAEVSPGGRLERALRAARGAEQGRCDPRPLPAPGSEAEPDDTAPCRGEPVPVTYALDADLLDTLRGMATGYDVGRSQARTVPGTGAEAAQAWSALLRDAVAPGGPSAGVLALPYADPDVVALTGLGSTLSGDIGPAVQLGRVRVADAVDREPLAGLGLAPPGPLTGDALEAYLGAGTRALVVTEDALPPRPPRQPQTSGARNPLATAAGELTGLVVDEGLSALLTPQAQGQGPRLAEQRWLVESALISAEDPDRTRTLVVAPARDADLVPAVAAQALLDSGRVPWLCAVPLSDAAAGRERCPSGGPVGQPDAARGAPLAPADDAPTLTDEQLRRVGAARRDIDQLTGAVLAPSEAAADTRARLLRAALRAQSSAWRDPLAQAQGRRLALLLHEDVLDLLGKVQLLTGPVTLTSTGGQLTVDVQNSLDQEITVQVGLLGATAARLRVEEGGVQTVPPRTSVPVVLRAEPRTSGRFPVKAQLQDRLGNPFNTSEEFVIRSTRYGTVALAATGLGVAVLMVATGLRLVRRALRR